MKNQYKLYYWPGIPGRAEMIRMVLEYLGEPYEDIARNPDAYALVGGARKSMPGTAHYAPPILAISDSFSLSQTPVITAYLATTHGLMPEGEKEWIAKQIDLTVHDIMTECHDTHHPVDKTSSYEDQRTESKRAAEVMTKKRFVPLLSHLEKCVTTHGDDGGPYLFGANLCYVDLSIAHLLRGIEYAFPKTFKEQLVPVIPRLLALRKAVDSCDKIADYHKSERCLPFTEGIFRQYPELDC